MSGTERTVDDSSSPSGDGKIRFKLFPRDQMEHFLKYQSFLQDKETSELWLPVANVYWGLGNHSQLLVNVDDIDIVRVNHCA